MSTECPEKKRQQIITNIMDTNKVPYTEAKKRLNESTDIHFPPLVMNSNINQRPESYSEVTKLRQEMNELKKILKVKDKQIENLRKEKELQMNEIIRKKDDQIETLQKTIETLMQQLKTTDFTKHQQEQTQIQTIQQQNQNKHTKQTTQQNQHQNKAKQQKTKSITT